MDASDQLVFRLAVRAGHRMGAAANLPAAFTGALSVAVAAAVIINILARTFMNIIARSLMACRLRATLSGTMGARLTTAVDVLARGSRASSCSGSLRTGAGRGA